MCVPVMVLELSLTVAPILCITDNYSFWLSFYCLLSGDYSLQEIPDDMGSKGLSKWPKHSQVIF